MKTILLAAVVAVFLHPAAAGSADPATYFTSVNGTTTNTNDAYLQWYQANQGKYNSTVFMSANTVDGSSGVALHWTIHHPDGNDGNDDDTKDYIDLAVAAQAEGWVGFGLAEAGGMLGSDMVVFEAAKNELFDAHVLGDMNAGPIPDDCQNWQLLTSTVEGGFLIFEARRLLRTGDAFDRAIVDDSDLVTVPHRVIAAWGDDEQVSYHGPQNRARTAIRFFRSDANDARAFSTAMSEQSEGSFEIRALDYPIKMIGTEYALFCFSSDSLVEMGVPVDTDLHVIGIEPIVDQDATAHVHHFVLTGSPLPNENSTDPAQCLLDEDFVEPAYTWAPGEGPLALPDNVGGPLGLNGFISYRLEIHYDNSKMVPNVLDSSGVRIYYTSKKREHDMGIILIGDPFVGLEGSPVGVSSLGYVQNTFECPGSCSEVALNQTNVTVLREYMHMHATGQRMSTDQVRDGKVIRTGSVDFWEFTQQGDMPVQQPTFEIQPGDSFRTTCYHKADDSTVWGLASQDEMCMSFLYYYPRKVISDGAGGEYPWMCAIGYFPECESAYTTEVPALESERDLGRIFGINTGSVTTCETVAAQTPASAPAPSAPSNGTSAAGRDAANRLCSIAAIFLGWILIGT